MSASYLQQTAICNLNNIVSCDLLIDISAKFIENEEHERKRKRFG